jgi:hypothetical protein
MKITTFGYKLILREPGKDEKIIWTGTKKECEKKRLDFSFTYNTKWLVVEEEERDAKEIEFSLSGFFSLLAICSLVYLYWFKNEKKICITD